MEQHPDEIVVPAFSLSNKEDSDPSKENELPTYSSWESIEKLSKALRSSDDELSVVTTNQNYKLSEDSRQDSFSESSSISRKVSTRLEEKSSREAPPPEAARVSPPSFMRKQHQQHQQQHHTASSRKRRESTKNPRSKFPLRRPTSIVRKWNKYADMEEQGLAASPRHRTKLAKSHLPLKLVAAASSSLDHSNESSEKVTIPPSEEEEEKGNEVATLPSIQESCRNRGLQDCKEENDNLAKTEVGLNPVEEECTLPFVLESCTNRGVQGEEKEDLMELPLNYNPVISGEPPVETFGQDGMQRITENGFPASVLDDDNDSRIQELSERPPTTKVTIRSTHESRSASISSISDNETEESSSNQSMQTEDTKNHQNARQEEIVTLSLAQILVQSYQPDPDNPGYWKKKKADSETKSIASARKSFLRKDSPVPSLNSFLGEVMVRRNEIMTKSNPPKAYKKEDEQSAPMMDWYGVKRQLQHSSQSRPLQMNHESPKDLSTEVKAKQSETDGRGSVVIKAKQKRVAVCNKPSSGSANDLLSELKAKQHELKRRSIQPKQETNFSEKGTGFLPDLMTELKAKQREIKNRSPAKGLVDPVVTTNTTTTTTTGSKKRSNPGFMSDLKARQREIEEHFYSRFANIQSTWSGNEAVVIPGKS
ncbi:MAG: hypothetical protein SGBAC_004528 [Bacillariaceae sp.]